MSNSRTKYTADSTSDKGQNDSCPTDVYLTRPDFGSTIRQWELSFTDSACINHQIYDHCGDRWPHNSWMNEKQSQHDSL